MTNSRPFIPVISLDGEVLTRDRIDYCYPDTPQTWSERAVDIMNVWLKYNATHPQADYIRQLLEKRKEVLGE